MRLTALLGASLLAAPAPASRAQEGSPGRPETIAPGIQHLEIRRAEPWLIHVLVLDPSRARIELARALDELVGAETTSSLALRRGALAAVNGGYFRTSGTYRGEPAGTLVMAGRIWSEPRGRPHAVAVSNARGRTRLALARVGVEAEIRARGERFPVAGFNRPREQGELIVYTQEFHRTTLTPPGGLEVLVRRGRVFAVRDGNGSAPIPQDGFVISADGAARDRIRVLRRGDRVELRTDLTSDPPFPFAPDFILGGGPALLSTGRAVAAVDGDGFAEVFRRTRHPRTAIGARADGTLVLAVVDGRQPATSVGMSIEELAALMRELGCAEALNLDGGGSTTMVVRGRVVNSPSDATGERPVSDALLVFAR